MLGIPPHIICNHCRATRRNQLTSTTSNIVERNKHNKANDIDKNIYLYILCNLDVIGRYLNTFIGTLICYPISNEGQFFNEKHNILSKLEDFHNLFNIKYSYFYMHVSLHNLIPMVSTFSSLHMGNLEIYSWLGEYLSATLITHQSFYLTIYIFL